MSEIIADFDADKSMACAASELPFWDQVYRGAFPNFHASHTHNGYGDHQKAGVDRTIICSNSKTFLIDEKIRGRNKKTGRVYDDIALEYEHEYTSGHVTKGWVEKELLCDYIAYAIAPLGVCYLLPVPALQMAWKTNKNAWLSKARDKGNRHHRITEAQNVYNGSRWVSRCLTVSVNTLYTSMGNILRQRFDPFDWDGAIVAPIAKEVPAEPPRQGYEYTDGEWKSAEQRRLFG